MSHKNKTGPLPDSTTRKQLPDAPCLADFARRGKLLAFTLATLAVSTPLFILAESNATLNESLPPGPMQQKATTACTECHEARIILQQRLSKTAWTKEVDKMTKWGALVDAGDRDALIDYLSENFSPEKPPYAPPRSSREKASTNAAGR